jgi:FAD/FMN-containing dehydrogenase
VGTTIDGSALESLRSALRGTAHAPGEEGYDEGRRAFNLNAHQQPAVVIIAEGAADVMASVRFARERSLGVGVLATGHGVASPCDGGVLVNTSSLRGVRVDPAARTARVEPGALWSDVSPEAQAHGLAGLMGFSSGVGVVGYTMGGGFGWLGRRYGFNADSVREADVVSAEGELLKASAHQDADLFWGIKGGGGNFGIVTSLEFSLYPITNVYGGNLFYPMEQAREVLELYAGWDEGLPDEMTSAVAFLNFPPVPGLPEPLRGGSFVAVRGCYCGERLEDGEELLRPARQELGEPIVDTFRIMPFAATDAIGMDPVDPIGAYGHVELLGDLSSEAVETLVRTSGVGSGSPLTTLQIWRLGGALTRPPSDLSPMGHSDSPYLMNGIGATPTPELAQAVQAHLAYLAEAVRPYASGVTYVNFIDLDGATPERVKAAYSPEDWERLVGLKDRYDPENVFRFNRNIPPSSAEQ